MKKWWLTITLVSCCLTTTAPTNLLALTITTNNVATNLQTNPVINYDGVNKIEVLNIYIWWESTVYVNKKTCDEWNKYASKLDDLKIQIYGDLMDRKVFINDGIDKNTITAISKLLADNFKTLQAKFTNSFYGIKVRFTPFNYFEMWWTTITLANVTLQNSSNLHDRSFLSKKSHPEIGLGDISIGISRYHWQQISTFAKNSSKIFNFIQNFPRLHDEDFFNTELYKLVVTIIINFEKLQILFSNSNNQNGYEIMINYLNWNETIWIQKE